MYAIYPIRQSAGASRGGRLKQPYQVVEAEFIPAGARAPVTGVDLIDLGSAPTLKVGSPVDLVHDRANTRAIRLGIGTRDWPTANARDAWIGLAGIGALIGGLVLLRLLFRSRKAAMNR